MEPLFASADAPPIVNYKSRFQEWALANVGENPRYLITNQTGPDHAREFTAEVWVGHQKYGEGRGRRKQDAEKQSAEDALRKLGIV
jgi:ribonuclease-3